MASQTPFPLMPPKSNELRLEHFDENVYTSLERQTTSKRSLLALFVDCLCGDAGAGSLKKQIFLQRLSASLDNIYGADLDYIFGSVRFLSRAESESYVFDVTQQLTSEQWDQIAVKDANYRARIREYFIACSKGATAEGIRQAVHAATSSDCQVIEKWRQVDNFGVPESVGRTETISYAAVDPQSGHSVHFNTKSAATSLAQSKGWTVKEYRPRSEFVIIPHKANLSQRESRMTLGMIRKISGIDSVVTIEDVGLPAYSPVKVRSMAADSSYFQVEKVVTGAPILEDLPAPEILSADLDPSRSWLRANSPELAPYAQFNITQEHSYTYLLSGGRRSPIDDVSYGTLREDGTISPEEPLEWFEDTDSYGPWTEYEKADSPDNYPGGRLGVTPGSAPARNANGTPYQFAYSSQDAYLAIRREEIVALGGQAEATRYRMPQNKAGEFRRKYTPDLAIASSAPVRESTVTSDWSVRSPRFFGIELRNPSLFVRS